MRNLGLRGKPLIEARVGDYIEFFDKEGALQSEEVIITCIRSGGIEQEMHTPRSKLQARRFRRYRQYVNKHVR